MKTAWTIYYGNSKFLIKLIIIAFIFVSIQNAIALPPNVKQLVDYETKANAVAERKNTYIMMPHYEIPLEWMDVLITNKMPKDVYDSLVFEKNGQKYVRWVINPEDTKWHKDVLLWLISKYENKRVTTVSRLVDKLQLIIGKSNSVFQKKYYFKGYQTASRSYIIEDPESKVQFSLKGSTDVTGGHWTDKKQKFTDAQDIIKVSQYLNKVESAIGFDNFFLLDEPLAFGIKDIDQAIVVRMLNQLPTNNKLIYLPGFSALHDYTGKLIALKNGSNNPEKFWKENYIEVMGKVLAELAVKTGLAFDSPHSQNFLIELDYNYKPTGRIGLRDFGDVFLNKNFLLNFNQIDLIETFSEQSNIKNNQSAKFGPLHGNSFPKWITESIYKEWGFVFFEAYENTMSKYSNINIDLIHKPFFQNGKYYNSNGYDQTSPEWQNYFANLKLSFRHNNGSYCTRLFK